MDELSAHLDRGWDLAFRGELAAARIAAEQCLALDEDSPEAHNLMGYVLAAEGHGEEALEHYRRAVEADETFLEAMLNAAEVLLSLGRAEEALEVFDEAWDLCESDDERADVLLGIMEAAMQAGRLKEAEHAAADLPEGPFENPELEVRVARVHYDLGRMDRAERHLRRALEQVPDHPDAHYYHGLVQLARGESVAAMASLLRARELDVDGPRPPWSQPRERFEAQVVQALRELPEEVSSKLEGAAVIVTDLPGAEIVADGVDPRIPAYADRVGPEGRVERLFVYQRNVERMARDLLDVPAEIARAVEEEVLAAVEEEESLDELQSGERATRELPPPEDEER